MLLLAVESGDHDLLRTVSSAVRAMSEGELLQIDKELRGVALPQMTLAETDAARRTNTAV